MKKSRITDEQIIGLQKQARLPDAVAPMQEDPGAVPAARPGDLEWRSFRQSDGQPFSGQNDPR